MMRPLAVLLGLSLLAAAPSGAQEVTAIRAGVLIDGKSSAARRDQVIVVRGHRIEAVGDAASTRIPEGAHVVDLSRATVLPGLIDCHTHIFLQGEDPAEGGYDVQLLKQGIAFRAARAPASPRGALSSRASRRSATSRPKARVTGTSESSRRSRAATFRGRACSW